MEETRIFRGPVCDMVLHDAQDDTWELVEHGDINRVPIIIGTREQILTKYDEVNKNC